MHLHSAACELQNANTIWNASTCTRMHDACSLRQRNVIEKHPCETLALSVLLFWALHLGREARDFGSSDAAIAVALERVSLARVLVHLLDLIDGFASTCDEQREVAIVLALVLIIRIRIRLYLYIT